MIAKTFPTENGSTNQKRRSVALHSEDLKDKEKHISVGETFSGSFLFFPLDSNFRKELSVHNCGTEMIFHFNVKNKTMTHSESLLALGTFQITATELGFPPSRE